MLFLLLLLLLLSLSLLSPANLCRFSGAFVVLVCRRCLSCSVVVVVLAISFLSISFVNNQKRTAGGAEHVFCQGGLKWKIHVLGPGTPANPKRKDLLKQENLQLASLAFENTRNSVDNESSGISLSNTTCAYQHNCFQCFSVWKKKLQRGVVSTCFEDFEGRAEASFDRPAALSGQVAFHEHGWQSSLDLNDFSRKHFLNEKHFLSKPFCGFPFKEFFEQFMKILVPQLGDRPTGKLTKAC